jgi:hypothetical protein
MSPLDGAMGMRRKYPVSHLLKVMWQNPSTTVLQAYMSQSDLGSWWRRSIENTRRGQQSPWVPPSWTRVRSVPCIDCFSFFLCFLAASHVQPHTASAMTVRADGHKLLCMQGR